MPARNFALCAVAAMFTTPPAQALDWLPTKEKVGARTCFATHYHHLEGGAFASKAGAEAVASRRWESFTRAEYGAARAGLARAEGKVMDCVPGKNTLGTVWSSKLEARPCRGRPGIGAG